MAASPGGCAFEVGVGLLELAVDAVAQACYALFPVEGRADLLVGLHEFIQLGVEVAILSLQHFNVGGEGFDLSGEVVVAVAHALVGEADVVELASRQSNLLLLISDLLLQIIG